MHFLTIMERHSNSRGTSNGHITSPGQSPILRGLVVPTRFKSCKPASCEVLVYEVFHLFSIASCSFSNLDFFLLIFLAFFPIIRVSLIVFGILFPFLLLSSLSVVTSHCWCALKGFKVNTLFLINSRVGILLSCRDISFKPSFFLSTSTTSSLSFYCFDLSSRSSISRSIFLDMKSLSSCCFFYLASSSAFLLI